jgi:hypothetical protein
MIPLDRKLGGQTMRKSTWYKVAGGVVTGGVALGEILINTLLPNAGWVSQADSRKGTIIGGIILAVSIPLAIWLWIHGIKQRAIETHLESQHKEEWEHYDKLEVAIIEMEGKEPEKAR